MSADEEITASASQNAICDLAIWVKDTFPVTRVRINHLRQSFSIVGVSGEEPSETIIDWSSKTGKFRLYRAEASRESFDSVEEIKARLSTWSF